MHTFLDEYRAVELEKQLASPNLGVTNSKMGMAMAPTLWAVVSTLAWSAQGL